MEIRLGILYDKLDNEDVKVEFKDELNQIQFEDFQNYIRIINELQSIRRLLNFVLINEDELDKYLQSSFQDLLHKSHVWPGVKRGDLDRVFLNANRLLLNYLGTIRTFIDHCETYFNRKFGEKSEEYLKFKSILSYFFDNSIAYRFFYKFRNYSQHCGIPLDNIQFTANHDRDNRQTNGVLKVTFNRDKLLSDYNEWGRFVKKDLMEMDEEFDVMPLLFEMTHDIKEISRNIELLNIKQLKDAISFITNMTKHLRIDNGEVFLAYDFITKSNGELLNFKMYDIPFDTIDYLEKIVILDK